MTLLTEAPHVARVKEKRPIALVCDYVVGFCGCFHPSRGKATRAHGILAQHTLGQLAPRLCVVQFVVVRVFGVEWGGFSPVWGAVLLECDLVTRSFRLSTGGK